jgi:hypothetical protein
MRQLLTRHPDSQCFAASQIEVRIERPHAESLLLSYVVTGAINDIRLPPAAAPARGDELWRHTCFEAFVCAASDAAYYEFNFAPSKRWAAYRFTSYRSGMSVAAEISGPPISLQASLDACALQTSLDLAALSSLPRVPTWRLGLSAIIEDTSGRMSYWALAHPPGKPDFHHEICFAYELSLVPQP